MTKLNKNERVLCDIKLIQSGINKFMINYVSNLVAVIQQFLLGRQSTSADREDVSCNPPQGDIYTYIPHFTKYIFYLSCIYGL